MSSNREHLLRLWAFPGLASVVILAVLVALLIHGKWWVVLIVALPVVLLVGTFLRTRRRVRLLFLNDKPDAMIDFLRSSMHRANVPHAQMIAAANLAKHYALWGHFDAALRELEPHDWSGAPDIYQSMRWQARALVRLLSRDDVAGGLADARRALALSDLPNVPGKAASLAAGQTYVDLGEILNGVADDGIADRLRARLAQSKFPLLILLLQWGLGLIYERNAQHVQAQAMRAALNASAPYCKPLQDFSR